MVPQVFQAPLVPPDHREDFPLHHQVLHRAGRQVHREQEAMAEHAGLMLADSIPVYIVTRTCGCEMVVLFGFTPSMSVVTL